MKITKSDLKEMIREILKEELDVNKTLTESTSTEMDWEDLIKAADNLLKELIVITDNSDYDDGDGYWSGEEGYKWTNRYLYYINSLNNLADLKKLCSDYSKKLPNVEFYYYEDEGVDGVSEIGYTATNTDYEYLI